MRKRLIASVALALVVLASFLQVVGPARIARDLAGLRPGWAAAAAVLALGTFLARSEGLRQLALGAGTEVAPLRFRLAFLGGVFAKQVLPAGNASGPALIAYAVNAETDNRYEQDLAVATVGELFNLATSLVVATAGLAVLAAAGRANAALVGVGVGVGIAAAVVTAIVFLLFVRRSALDGLVHRLAAVARATAGRLSGRVEAAAAPERVAAWLASFGEALSAIAADRRAVATGLGYALVAWGCFCLALYASAVALGSPVPLALALFVVPAGGLASAVPLPGGVGSVEVAMAALLVAFAGVELVAATATVLLFRLVSFWLVLAVGGAAALYLSVDVREMPRDPVDPSPPA